MVQALARLADIPASPASQVVVVQPGEWFGLSLLEPVFGITSDAAKKYRANGKWLEGVHYRKDGERIIWYCKSAIEKWMETGS
jgi:hypothetical protein